MKIIQRLYELKDPRIKNNYTYMNISDIHSNYKALLKIKKTIDDINPDFIVMTGDIVDTVDNSNNDKTFNVINEISTKYPIYLSYGNHDCVSSLHRHIMTGDYSVLDNVEKNKLIILANRGFYNYADDLNIISFNTTINNWYYEQHEEPAPFLNEFNNEYKPSQERFNILLTHSPNPFFDEKGMFINNGLLDHSIVNCGHNHGGFVLPAIQDHYIGKKKYGIGLVGPYHRLFQHNAYGFYSNMNSSIVINNAVTKWSDCNGRVLGGIANSILLPEVDVITLTPGEEHKLTYKGRKKV